MRVRGVSQLSVLTTVCFLEMVPSDTYELRNKQIVFIKRVYTEGTVVMKPAVFNLMGLDMASAILNKLAENLQNTDREELCS